MAQDLAIEAVSLTKSYGTVRVLTGVDLQVSRGSVFALLGPNGAGKTTTVRILATLIPPDDGHASVGGFDVVRERHRVRRTISLTGQYAAIDGLQTGEENLAMMGRLSGLRGKAARNRARDLLDRFDLADAGRRRVKTYSGGMRRRLDLAASLVGQPAVIFLDEPTTGLDPRSRQSMWEVITDLTASGVTVFLTTQYLEEADQLAERLAVVDRGHVVAEGTPVNLKRRVAQQRVDLTVTDAAVYADLVRFLGDRAIHGDPTNRTIGVATDGSAAHLRELLDELDPHRTDVHSFAVHTATLDDVFLALTGHTTAAAEAADDSATEKEPAHV